MKKVGKEYDRWRENVVLGDDRGVVEFLSEMNELRGLHEPYPAGDPQRL